MAAGIISYSRPAMKRRILAGDTPAWILKHPRRDYILAAILATCAWVSKDELRRIDAEAKLRTKVTGILHVVGHIAPLNSKWICGLTVPLNLEVVPYAKNARDSNHWGDRIMDMFCEPEQLTLFREFS